MVVTDLLDLSVHNLHDFRTNRFDLPTFGTCVWRIDDFPPESAIRHTQDLRGGIQPEFVALFGPNKSIRAGENLFALNSAFWSFLVPFIREANLRNLLTGQKYLNRRYWNAVYHANGMLRRSSPPLGNATPAVVCTSKSPKPCPRRASA
jgi:hypothetical protein